MLNIYRPSLYSLLGTALVLSLAFGCSSDSKKEVRHDDLQGLWKLEETNYELIEDKVPNGEGNSEPEGGENGGLEGEDGPSGVSALSAEPGEEDGSQVYPSKEGVQPYLRLRLNDFDFFEVRPTDTLFHHKEQAYTHSITEINFNIEADSLLTMGYSIDGNKLVLIRKTGQYEIFHHLKKLSTDPFIPEPEEEEEVPEIPINDCSGNHNPEAEPGSTANPYLLTLNKDTTVLLIPTTAENGYETRFYLEVKTSKPYRIIIDNYASESEFSEVMAPFRYFELSATESFASEYHLFTPLRIAKGDPFGKAVDIYPVTPCLYIRLFTYINDLSVSLRVVPLFEEERAADNSEEDGTPEA